jgi:hypothetical protein
VLGITLNCPIPWEMASLGDDWSPTRVEGIVDKLPPERVIRCPPRNRGAFCFGSQKCLALQACRLGDVGGRCYDSLTKPPRKG